MIIIILICVIKASEDRLLLTNMGFSILKMVCKPSFLMKILRDFKSGKYNSQ